MIQINDRGFKHRIRQGEQPFGTLVEGKLSQLFFRQLMEMVSYTKCHFLSHAAWEINIIAQASSPITPQQAMGSRNLR